MSENTNILPFDGISGSKTQLSRRSRRAVINPEALNSQDLSTETKDPQEGDNTELVVELSQGQRLILRGIQPGVIIEVAAWSGTDSPGENAVRMLFGAGQSKSEPADIHDSGSRKAQNLITKAENSTHESNLLYGLDKQSENYAEISEHQKQRRKRMRRRLFWVFLIIGTISAIFFGLSSFNLIQFVHPKSGLTNTLGAADTSIALVGPSIDLETNSSVMFVQDSENVLGGVIAVEDGKVLVYTGEGQAVVPRESVIGRVLLVVPFIGVIAGIFGG